MLYWAYWNRQAPRVENRTILIWVSGAAKKERREEGHMSAEAVASKERPWSRALLRAARGRGRDGVRQDMEPGIKKERPPGGAKLQTAKSGTKTGNTVGTTRSWTNQETEGVIFVSRGGPRAVQDLSGKVPLRVAQLLMGITTPRSRYCHCPGRKAFAWWPHTGNAPKAETCSPKPPAEWPHH